MPVRGGIRRPRVQVHLGKINRPPGADHLSLRHRNGTKERRLRPSHDGCRLGLPRPFDGDVVRQVAVLIQVHDQLIVTLSIALMAVALYLLSTLDENTPSGLMNLYFFLLGASLGLIIQVLVIAVQNTVSYSDLGAATSGVTFFRTIGGAFGVSIVGAIFTNQLASKLAAALAGKKLPPGFHPAQIESDPSAIKSLPPDLHHAIVNAFSLALHPAFLTAVPIAVISFILAFFLREVPLRAGTDEVPVRTAASAADLGEALGAAPTQRSSQQEVERVLARLSGSDLRRFGYARLARSAGIDLPGGACWVLAKLARHGATPGPELAKMAGITLAEGRPTGDVLVSPRPGDQDRRHARADP